MKKFIKKYLGIALSSLIVGGIVLGAPIVVQQWNNSKNEISQKRILFTIDGTTTGQKVMDINSGGNIFAYGPMKDGSGNSFITGGALSGYMIGNTGDYITNSRIDTGLNNPTSDTIILSEKATVEYVSGQTLRRYIDGILSPKITTGYSIDIGHGGSISGDRVVKIGDGASVSGTLSVSIGRAVVDANFGVGIGFLAETYGTTGGIAIGYATTSDFDYSTTIGNHVEAPAPYSTVIGSWNVLGLTNSLFQIGIGTGISNRHTAMSILNDGTAEFYDKVNIGNSSYTGYTLSVSGDTMISKGGSWLGGFAIDVLGKRVGVFGGAMGISTGASIYGQTDIGTALYGESTGTGASLTCTSNAGRAIDILKGGIYFASGTDILSPGRNTGDALIAMSGGRLTVLYWSTGVRNVSSYLTP